MADLRDRLEAKSMAEVSDFLQNVLCPNMRERTTAEGALSLALFA